MVVKVKFAEDGFTLVEALVAMLLTGVVMISIFSAFQSQNNTYLAQDQVAEMQQEVRISLDMLAMDLRHAGYNPKGAPNTFTFYDGEDFSGITVLTNATALAFTTDLDEDGEIDTTAPDVNGDTFKDLSEMEEVAWRLNGTKLQRYSTITGFIEWQTVAENIDRIEFCFLDIDEEDDPETVAREDMIPYADLPTHLAKIKGVVVSILAKARKPDSSYTNTEVYTPASGTPWDLNGAQAGNAANDNFRRRLLIKTMQCRNMGI